MEKSVRIEYTVYRVMQMQSNGTVYVSETKGLLQQIEIKETVI